MILHIVVGILGRSVSLWYVFCSLLWMSEACKCVGLIGLLVQ